MLKIEIIPVIISIIVTSIMVFSIYVTAKYSSPVKYKKTRLNVFFTTLASLAVIFVGLNIVLSTISFEYDKTFSHITKTKEAVDKLWIYPNELLVNYQHLRPEFVAGFFMNNPILYEKVLAHPLESPLSIRTILEEQFVSYAILQAWEDCLTFRKYDLTPMKSWVEGFLVWAQNPYFKPYYHRLIFSYRDSTKIFGDLLMEYAARIPVPTNDPSIYKKTAEKLVEDSRFIDLMKSLKNPTV